MNQMQKISIIGVSGIGKTTLARKISSKTEIPIIYIDSYIWEEDWKLVDREKAQSDLRSALSQHKKWIIEGYLNYIPEEILLRPDIVLYLKFNRWIVLFRNIKRWLKHRKHKRDELPNGCEERLSLERLWQIFRGDTIELNETALKKYPPRKLVILSSPSEVKNFLDSYTF